MNIAAAIVTAAGLDFLGVGDPTVISWGNQIASGRIVLASGWWLTLFPGIALIVTIVAFNLLADGMRDVLDPRLS
jgi:peptide/nickel transport system permease protein